MYLDKNNGIKPPCKKYAVDYIGKYLFFDKAGLIIASGLWNV